MWPLPITTTLKPLLVDTSWASLGAQRIKKSARKAGDWGSIPGLGRSAGDGNGNPLQYSCLKNSMDRGIQRATVHVVAESDMTEQLTHTWTFAIHKSVGLEMTSALKKCPGVGLGKRIQNRADFQEANFKSYNFTHSAYLYSRKQRFLAEQQ